MQARESIAHCMPERSSYQYELRGDLGGTEIRGDIEAIELSAYNMAAKA